MGEISLEILEECIARAFAKGVAYAKNDTSNMPDFVGTAWLNEKTGLSVPTILKRLSKYKTNSQSLIIDPRVALPLLTEPAKRVGRPRNN